MKVRTLTVLLYLCLPSILFSQSANNNGHLIQEAMIQEQNGNTLLQIKGSFSGNLDSQVQVLPDENLIHTQIVFYQALLHPSFQTPALADSSSVSQIKVSESIEGTQADRFKVTVHVNTMESSLIRFDKEASNSKTSVFVIKPQRININPVSQVQEDLAMEEASTESSPKEASMSTAEMKEPSMDEVVAVNKDAILLHPVSALLVYQRPTLLQVSILNASMQNKSAEKLATLLDRHQRRNLEENLGMKLEITNISSVREATTLPKTKIYFRPNYLAAALALADKIPGEQIIEPMPMDRKGRLGIDVEIYVGVNFQ